MLDLQEPDADVVQSACVTVSIVEPQVQDCFLLVKEQQIRLQPYFVKILLEVFRQVRDGNAISIVPSHAELTTKQAADILNVSRPYYVTQLLKKGEMAYEMRGTHHRIRLDEVLRYKQRRSTQAKAALRDLIKGIPRCLPVS